MNQKCAHYWRIHAKVVRRALADIHPNLRDVITNDVDHETAVFKWFENKVADDTQRLFEDATYYDNQEYTFRYPKD